MCWGYPPRSQRLVAKERTAFGTMITKWKGSSPMTFGIRGSLSEKEGSVAVSWLLTMICQNADKSLHILHMIARQRKMIYFWLENMTKHQVWLLSTYSGDAPWSQDSFTFYWCDSIQCYEIGHLFLASNNIISLFTTHICTIAIFLHLGTTLWIFWCHDTKQIVRIKLWITHI